VRAALDGVPDPVNGLLIYRGRGGAAGSTKPRKPKPAPGAASLELEEPKEERWIKRARMMGARKAAVDELLRELQGEPGRVEPVPAEPERMEPGPGEPLSRDIAAFDRSGE